VQRFTDDFLEKFQAEVPALTQLSHPNLVRFMGVCVDNTLVYMQGYIRGCSLWGYLRNTGNLVDLTFIAKTSKAIAAALFYLHQHNIIHRNLHSKNVLLDGEMVPRLRDFGMAYIKSETYAVAVGPVATEAPELLARQPFTNAVDVYSFGVVLWSLFYFQTLFRHFSNLPYERELWSREDPYKTLAPIVIKEQVLANDLRPDITVRVE
jgi:serine/threonine protein kinase